MNKPKDVQFHCYAPPPAKKVEADRHLVQMLAASLAIAQVSNQNKAAKK